VFGASELKKKRAVGGAAKTGEEKFNNSPQTVARRWRGQLIRLTFVENGKKKTPMREGGGGKIGGDVRTRSIKKERGMRGTKRGAR